MIDRTRVRSRSILVVCACLVLAGIIAIVWGLNRPMPSQSIPLPSTSTASASATSPGSAKPGAVAPTPSTTTSRATPAVPAVPVSNPVKVAIPSVNEGSTLLRLGTTAQGELQVPTQAQAHQAAWFNGSPKPGQDGPAVILGHVINAEGPAVFYKLGDVQVGEVVKVTDADGRVLTFTVYRVASYPKTHFPTKDVYGNTAGPELRVITCGGVFNSKTGHYLNNTVLYARLSS